MLQPVILAAGKGTRMRSELPKALFPLAGKPLIRWVLDSLVGLRAETPVVVVGHKAELIQTALGGEVRYAEQKEISGTASAVNASLPQVAPTDSVLTLYCDQPFLSSTTILTIQKLAEEHPEALVMGTTVTPDFAEWRESFVRYGRIVRSQDGVVQKIVEYKDATEEERAIHEVNPGIYCVQASWLAEALIHIKPSAVSGEFYLTDIVEYARQNGTPIITTAVLPQEALGVNSVEDAQRAEGALTTNS